MKAKIKKGVCFGCTRIFSYADKGTQRRFCTKYCYVEFIKKPTKTQKDETVKYKSLFLLTAFFMAIAFFNWLLPEITYWIVVVIAAFIEQIINVALWPITWVIFLGLVFYKNCME